MKEEITNANNYADWLKWVSDAEKEGKSSLNLQVVHKSPYCYKFIKQKVMALTIITMSS
jgi:hypothetical protein